MFIKGAGAAALALAAIVAIPQANAAVTVNGFTFDTGTFGAQTGVHFDSQVNTNTVDAFVNQDGSAVTFTSTGAITGGANGQGEATITGPMADLTVNFAKSWNNLTFAFSNDVVSNFTMFVNGVALFNSGNCSFCDLKKNANNQFTLSGPGIQTVAFTFDPSIETAKQFRVEGVGSVVPEPATWALMILGFGAIGGTLRIRSRKVRFAS